MSKKILRMCNKIASYVLPDKAYIKINYRLKMHKRLNLQNPETFSEKLQYLKLYDRNPMYTKMVDKIEAKSYVASMIGEEHVIPLICVWDKVQDIDFASLPNRFVLKVSHDSGGLVICKDKSKADFDEIKNFLGRALKIDYFRYSREWPYKNAKPRVFAEKYMEDAGSDGLIDYKFYCFGGEPKFLYVSRFEHTPDEELSFFDLDWKLTPFQRVGHKLLTTIPEKPQHFAQMLEIAKKLSANIPFVRVDLYEVNGYVFFGELSFFPGGGFSDFAPLEWSKKIAEYIVLPNKNKVR